MRERVEGKVDMRNSAGNVVISLDANKGLILVFDDAGNEQYRFDRNHAAAWFGGSGDEGDVIVRDHKNKERIKLDGGDGDLWVKDSSGQTLFHFDSTNAGLFVGGAGNEGDVVVRDSANKERIKLDAGDGDIWVKDSTGRTWFLFDSRHAALYVGGTGYEGDVIVRDQNNKETIKLDGGLGDIILKNADVAEDFSVSTPDKPIAGTVMIVGEDGRLEPCSSVHDTRVIGVVSYAGRYCPGMILDRQSTHDDTRVPISIMGKVACRATAINGPVKAGDMLTTACEHGRAMRVSDHNLARGAILGKALGGIDSDEGLVEMLVNLQLHWCIKPTNCKRKTISRNVIKSENSRSTRHAELAMRSA